jgi:hypothetical protein
VRAIVLLQREPHFRPFPFGLPLEGPVGRAVADATRLLARTPGRFDGPIAFCHGISPEGAILRRAGRYSEATVVFEEPTLAYRLGFALGVQVFVERDDQVLFQLRARAIGRDPLLWTASASGGLKPGEEPRIAVLADAAEEINISEADLLDFRAIAVVTNDDTGSALIVHRASLAPGAEPRADPGKVAELRWAARPSELGGQVSADTLACWEALERSRVRGD